MKVYGGADFRVKDRAEPGNEKRRFPGTEARATEELTDIPLAFVGRASLPVFFRGGLCPPSPRRRPGSRKKRLVPGLRREDGSACATVFGNQST
ncbi:MAG: hypothetical protein V1792_06190 [Pseudomonadota bacterium]